MARTKGSKNKNSSALPDYVLLSTESRIEVLANLIVDKIFDDLENGQKILKKLNTVRNA
jgi:hypothetical protein